MRIERRDDVRMQLHGDGAQGNVLDTGNDVRSVRPPVTVDICGSMSIHEKQLMAQLYAHLP